MVGEVMATMKIQVDTTAAHAAIDAIVSAVEITAANPPNLLPMHPRAYVRVFGAMLVARSFGKRKHRRGWATL